MQLAQDRVQWRAVMLEMLQCQVLPPQLGSGCSAALGTGGAGGDQGHQLVRSLFLRYRGP
jgi:hypothetical protein